MTAPPDWPPRVDTHCHLDLYPEPGNLAWKVERQRIYTLAVTNAPSAFPSVEGVTRNCKFIRPALGLHPLLAAERLGEIPLFRRLLARTRYVGEVGLDFSARGRETRLEQVEAFSTILDLCHKAGDKILSVHSRSAAAEAVDMFPDDFRGTAILHWFSGSKRVLHRAIDKGMYFSVNIAMTRSTSGLAVLRDIPLNRILTESDGPFVTWGGQPTSPVTVGTTLEHVARQIAVPTEQLRGVVYENFARILRSSDHTTPSRHLGAS